ncbi:MAG TPA: isoprenylcysteine carboxylmethyltransferase family protein [Gammaproteobacteria bacterium]|nr:isoprenylcysteine carboxylmethyltransferase family protein [Gammaproteobacteria bacterium]
MGRAIIALYGALSYLVFLITFLYAIGFVGDLFVPKTIDSGTAATSTAAAFVIDVLLLGLFAVQHSGMARRGFKGWLTKVVPRAAERSTYVLLSSAALILLFWLWQPLPGVIWQVESPAGQLGLYILYALGWLIVLTGTFMINHFDLFGLQQVWLNLRGRSSPPSEFRTTLFYKVVRHPLMLGFVIAFWATPYMSVGHLLFSVATSGYILVALQLEERDLVAAFGDTYRDYRRRVPMLLPLPHRRPKAAVDLGKMRKS